LHGSFFYLFIGEQTTHKLVNRVTLQLAHKHSITDGESRLQRYLIGSNTSSAEGVRTEETQAPKGDRQKMEFPLFNDDINQSINQSITKALVAEQG